MKHYENIRIEPAQNGYVLRCTKCAPPAGTESQFANVTYVPVEWVFPKGKEKEMIAKMDSLHEKDEE